MKGDFIGGPVVKKPPANSGTQVQSLVQKDPTCCRAAKPVHHDCANTLESASCNY